MRSRTQDFKKQKLNLEQWQKLYYQNQQSYLRVRLLAIKLLSEGKTRIEVAQSVNCTYKTLTSWIDKYREGGLEKLTEPIKHQVRQRLNPAQKQQFKQMLLQQTPMDYGIDRNLWTAKIMLQIIEQKWNVRLKDSRIYEIIQELNLSYQRSHRDYANADKIKQKQFVELLKKTEN
jgi:transposase